MQVSILGCGWLGLPLAESLIANGIMVKGSATGLDKLPALAGAGITPFAISVTAAAITGDLKGFLGGSQMLIINIPPKIKEGRFPEKMARLIPYIEASGIQRVLFVSSVSVYGDGNRVMDEKTMPNPSTENGKQLLEAEKLLQDNPCFSTTIVRFGGLIGGGRHPVYHLSGRKGLENPDAPVNLIHQDDCVGIILKIIDDEAWGEIFNAVAPYHPTREVYYMQKAAVLGLPAPLFAEEKGIGGKTVQAEKAIRMLGYTFKGI